MIASPPNPPFSPDDSLARSIISALAAPHASLDAVAKAHGISVADLCLWLSTPAARLHLDPLERGACAAVRVAATLNLNAAIDTLTQILNDFRAFAQAATQSKAQPGLSPSDPVYQRAAIHARRAAHHLGRLARIVPIDEDHIQDMLAAARVRAQARASGSSATASRATGCLPTSAPGLSSSPPPPRPSGSSATASRATGCAVGGPTSASDSSSSRLPSPRPSAPVPLRPSAPVSSSPPLRNSASSATSAFSSSSRPSRSRSPADLIRAATGPPLPRGSSP